MQRSETITALAKALAQAQGELQNPTKSTKNTFFNSKYADLAEVLNVVREVLPGFGLSIVQNPDFDVQASILTMETILLHESGEWMSSSLRCPVPPQQGKDGKVLPMGPQALGSATTYLRRYGVASIVGIAQEDDDGESLSDQNRKGGKDQGRSQESRPPQNQATASQQPAQQKPPTQGNGQAICWPIGDQEAFADLMDQYYQVFKDAGRLDLHPDKSATWRQRMANDTPENVLPALRTAVSSLREALTKPKASQVVPSATEEPAA